MIKQTFLLVVLFFSFNSFSQNVQLSVYSEISIITSGPGDNLYEKFGHTAIRVKDPVLNFDLLYNYGIFDFSDPNFYSNFVKGFMKYKLARYPFQYALQSAKDDERWVNQQVLNLTQEEKNRFFYFLENNALPQNATYFYDPFFDNCATRPRDIIKTILKDQLILNGDFIKEEKSIRTLMNEKIHPNSWGSFGINIALGSRLDKTASLEEYLFLPEYLMHSIQGSKIKRASGEENLLKDIETLVAYESKVVKSDFLSPLLVFSILFLLVLAATYFDIKKQKRTKVIDFLMFFSSGIVGILIVFLWGFTNHSTAPNNFNFLWAFAPNLFISFFVLKTKLKKWIQYYVLFLLILLVVLPFIHAFGIQKFTYPLIPLLGIYLVRYGYLYTFLKQK